VKKLLYIYIITLSTISYSQTAITDANFNQAIETCLSTNPVDGMCSDSEYGAMPDWDVSQVTNMSLAFINRSDFNADISTWDVSSVTDMSQMFNYASSFNQPIGSWDVSSVTNMSYMFLDASSFNQPLWEDFIVNDWDVSSVTNMSYMFLNATSFNQNISSWCVTNIVSEPNNFSLNSALIESNQPIWGTCPSLDITPITDANFTLAIQTCLSTNPYDGMCSDSEYGAIPNWDVSQVTNMSNAFQYSYFDGDISNWDVSSVTNMKKMFYLTTSFNQPIGDWDVSNVTNMGYMLYSANLFNQDLSSWCVTNIPSEPTYFSYYTQMNADPASDENQQPIWGTCPSFGLDDQNQPDISIYPNPTDNYLFIEGNKNPISISIYNLLGAEVISKSNTGKIDVSKLSNGVYIIKISDGIGQIDRKFIKN
jgi:surface protein